MQDINGQILRAVAKESKSLTKQIQKVKQQVDPMMVQDEVARQIAQEKPFTALRGDAPIYDGPIDEDMI